MEWSSLNSLAEVGVGVNLAFGLVTTIREHFSHLFERMITNKKDSIKTILNEVKNRSNGGLSPSSFAIKLDDIAQRYRTTSVWTERILVFLAFFIAFALTYFLFEAALEPQKEIAWWWAIVAILLVWAPLLLSSLVHAIAYLLARRSMGKREQTYREMVDLLDTPIIPTPVDN